MALSCTLDLFKVSSQLLTGHLSWSKTSLEFSLKIRSSRSFLIGSPWKLVHNKIRLLLMLRFLLRHEKFIEWLWCSGTCLGYLSPSIRTDGCLFGKKTLHFFVSSLLGFIGKISFGEKNLNAEYSYDSKVTFRWKTKNSRSILSVNMGSYAISFA